MSEKVHRIFSNGCYFVNIVQSIIVEEVHFHCLKTFETR